MAGDFSSASIALGIWTGRAEVAVEPGIEEKGTPGDLRNGEHERRVGDGHNDLRFLAQFEDVGGSSVLAVLVVER